MADRRPTFAELVAEITWSPDNQNASGSFAAWVAYWDYRRARRLRCRRLHRRYPARWRRA